MSRLLTQVFKVAVEPSQAVIGQREDAVEDEESDEENDDDVPPSHVQQRDEQVLEVTMGLRLHTCHRHVSVEFMWIGQTIFSVAG